MGLGLGSAASTGEGQGGRTGDIFVQGREEWGLVPANTLEWRQTSGRGNCGRIPPTGVARTKKTMQRSAVFISWLFLSIWPMDWGWNPDEKLTVAQSAELPPKYGTELGPTVRDHIKRETMQVEDVV